VVKKFTAAAMVLATLFLMSSLVLAKTEETSKELIIAIATEAVRAEGYKLEEANIIYDEGGKLWSEKIGKITNEDASPNFGVLKQGFLKNYRIVYFDFKDPLPDVWVFIDKDTGEVLTVYREEPAG
jgi:hypothetical protein